MFNVLAICVCSILIGVVTTLYLWYTGREISYLSFGIAVFGMLNIIIGVMIDSGYLNITLGCIMILMVASEKSKTNA